VRLAERLAKMLAHGGPIAEHVRLRAGYDAVPDFRSAEIKAVDLLQRARSAMRHAGANNSGAARIIGFDSTRRAS
jgi:hypothetical protein